MTDQPNSREDRRDDDSADAPFTPLEWHIRELERRLSFAQANPVDKEPWEDVLARLLRK